MNVKRMLSAFWVEHKQSEAESTSERTVNTLWTHGERTEKWESWTFQGLYYPGTSWTGLNVLNKTKYLKMFFNTPTHLEKKINALL